MNTGDEDTGLGILGTHTYAFRKLMMVCFDHEAKKRLPWNITPHRRKET